MRIGYACDILLSKIPFIVYIVRWFLKYFFWIHSVYAVHIVFDIQTHALHANFRVQTNKIKFCELYAERKDKIFFFDSHPFTRKAKAIFSIDGEQSDFLSLLIWLLQMVLSAFYPWRRECCLGVSCFISIVPIFDIVTSIQILTLRTFVR